MDLVKLEGVTFQIVNKSSCSVCEFKDTKDNEHPCRSCKKNTDLALCSIKTLKLY